MKMSKKMSGEMKKLANMSGKHNAKAVRKEVKKVIKSEKPKRKTY